MNYKVLGISGSWLLGIVLALTSLAADAATGYMSFLNTPNTVETGDAASYMQVGRDCNASPCAVGAMGIAQPTLQQKSRITTSRTSTHLVLQFDIPDITSGPPGPALIVGDKVIVQIDPNNSAGAGLQSGPTAIEKDYRYEIRIVNRRIVDSGTTVINKPELYLPFDADEWDFAIAATTSATATWDTATPGAGGRYQFTLSIPRSELGITSTTANVGIALAILNDLGHSHMVAGTRVHELAGTAFPMTMGITPTSEPGIIQESGVASGNWNIPSQWGTGYFSAPVNAEVVFDYLPSHPALSSAIRLGNCNALWNDIRPVPGLSGWEAWQQDPANRWYLYNPPPGNPCRMSIWMNAKVQIGGAAAPVGTLTKRRFLVVWGRPNIGGNDWYVAGLTAPVTLNGPETQANFIWNNPPPVAFTGHPCMRVYVLPENLNGPSLPLQPGQTTNEEYIKAIDTQSELATFEAAYSLSGNRVAQMNFSNIGPSGGCTNGICQPLLGFSRPGERLVASLDGWSAAGEILAANTERARETGVSRNEGQDKSPPRVLVKATGFGVAKPEGKARYVYVEDIGAIAWAMPATYIGETIKDLRFEVANPRVAATTQVGGKTKEILAPPRQIFLALEAAAPAGTALPRFNTKELDSQLREPLAPGAVMQAQLGLSKGEGVITKPPCAHGCSIRKNPCRDIASVDPTLPAALLMAGGMVFLRRRKPEPQAKEDDKA